MLLPGLKLTFTRLSSTAESKLAVQIVQSITSVKRSITFPLLGIIIDYHILSDVVAFRI